MLALFTSEGTKHDFFVEQKLKELLDVKSDVSQRERFPVCRVPLMPKFKHP